MSPGHPVLIEGETGARFSDCFERRYSDVAPPAGGHTRAKGAAQKRFRLTGQKKPLLEHSIRLEERSRERARILRELHDTLLQGFLGGSSLLKKTVKQTSTDSP